jgi:FtsP/CotA-like multicopper oxidase with cupredoxin domain
LITPRITRNFNFDRDNGQWVINGRFANCNELRFAVTQNTAENWVWSNPRSDWQHPIHVHLDPFQVLERHPATVAGATVCIGAAPDDGVPHMRDDNELGLKDTVRVNPNEVVDIVVRFEVFCGRYMYHCHILEHEDNDMMRPFVVMPAELMPFMDMHEGHGAMTDMKDG